MSMLLQANLIAFIFLFFITSKLIQITLKIIVR